MDGRFRSMVRGFMKDIGNNYQLTVYVTKDQHKQLKKIADKTRIPMKRKPNQKGCDVFMMN